MGLRNHVIKYFMIFFFNSLSPDIRRLTKTLELDKKETKTQILKTMSSGFWA